MEFHYYLSQHLKKYPSAQPQDIVKLCYQAAYGAEHLLTNIEAAKKYFYSEYDSVSARPGELYEALSSDICRIHLSAWKEQGLPSEWLFSMFLHSASVSQGCEELFLSYLQTAESVLCNMDTSFSLEAWNDYLADYKASGMPSVHHSEIYRKTWQPSYRIVNRRFLSVLPILEKAALLPKAPARVIAIDGRAGSGKSTMANLLQQVLDAPVIHMDDFFLPPGLRSEERLAEAGGNIHYERFAKEVLPYIRSAESFSYRYFNCSKMDFDGEKQIGASDWRIVEGSYSHHPKFGNYADLKIFSDISADEQMERIVRRDGGKMAEVFRKRWIPMEELYFEKYRIRDMADLSV